MIISYTEGGTEFHSVVSTEVSKTAEPVTLLSVTCNCLHLSIVKFCKLFLFIMMLMARISELQLVLGCAVICFHYYKHVFNVNHMWTVHAECIPYLVLNLWDVSVLWLVANSLIPSLSMGLGFFKILFISESSSIDVISFDKASVAPSYTAKAWAKYGQYSQLLNLMCSIKKPEANSLVYLLKYFCEESYLKCSL